MARKKLKVMTDEYIDYRHIRNDMRMISTRGKMFSDCRLALEFSDGQRVELHGGHVHALEDFIEKIKAEHWPKNIYDL